MREHGLAKLFWESGPNPAVWGPPSLGEGINKRSADKVMGVFDFSCIPEWYKLDKLMQGEKVDWVLERDHDVYTRWRRHYWTFSSHNETEKKKATHEVYNRYMCDLKGPGFNLVMPYPASIVKLSNRVRRKIGWMDSNYNSIDPTNRLPIDIANIRWKWSLDGLKAVPLYFAPIYRVHANPGYQHVGLVDWLKPGQSIDSYLGLEGGNHLIDKILGDLERKRKQKEAKEARRKEKKRVAAKLRRDRAKAEKELKALC